jgi:hypothetical protein
MPTLARYEGHADPMAWAVIAGHDATIGEYKEKIIHRA